MADPQEMGCGKMKKMFGTAGLYLTKISLRGYVALARGHVHKGDGGTLNI